MAYTAYTIQIGNGKSFGFIGAKFIVRTVLCTILQLFAFAFPFVLLQVYFTCVE